MLVLSASRLVPLSSQKTPHVLVVPLPVKETPCSLAVEAFLL